MCVKGKPIEFQYSVCAEYQEHLLYMPSELQAMGNGNDNDKNKARVESHSHQQSGKHYIAKATAAQR